MVYKRIGEILFEEALIDEERLRLGLEEQVRTEERLGETLIKLGYITEKDRLRALSIQFGIPVINLQDFLQHTPSLDLHPSIKFLKQYKIAPFEQMDGILKVIVSDPLINFPIDALKTFTGLKIEKVLGSEKDVLAVIESLAGDDAVTVEKIVEGMENTETDSDGTENEDIAHLKDLAQEAPIINLVNLFITKAIEKRASDIHIEPFEESLCIRYRIDGILYRSELLPRRLQSAIASRVKIMAKLNIAEHRLPQDGRINLKVIGKDIDIRVSTVPTLYGESIVMRLLDPTGVISLENLGFSFMNINTFEEIIRKPYGMVLVTGPTGSGKSTTLYAALLKMDISGKKVITIEDPIEYYLEGVNQIQVKPKIGLSFAKGLRSIVRQDPDVIMIGEIRDKETAEIAVHSALTGHLILSTLHTNDAPGAVTRLIDMGIESYLISSSLIGVLAQRLVRVICHHCKAPHEGDHELVKSLLENKKKKEGIENLELQTYNGAGCDKCDNTGYMGRTGIFEFMSINDDIRQLIVEKSSSDIIRKKALEQGMISLRDDGIEKVRQGVTTVEEIARVTLEER